MIDGEGLGREWDALRAAYPDWCIHRGMHDRPANPALRLVWAHPGETPPRYGAVVSARTGLHGETAALTPAELERRIRRQVELRREHGKETAP